jgi:hypothetical protein
MAHASDSDILQIQLSASHSLDIIRLPKSRKYRVIFAERSGVQRRAFVEISFEQSLKLAKFLANVDSSSRILDEPGQTAKMPKIEDSPDLRRSRSTTIPDYEADDDTRVVGVEDESAG